MNSFRLVRIFLPSLLIVFLFSCKPNKIELSGTGYNVPATAGNQATELSTKQSWTVISDQTWCTVNPTSGEGDASIQINYAENKSIAVRVATLTFATEKGASETITITQAVDPSTQLLCEKNWRISAVLVNAMDVFPSMPNCNRDDFTTFLTNGTNYTDEGPTKCNATDPQTYGYGNWQFGSAKTHIIITDTGSSSVIDATILQLDATTFKITYSDATYVYIITFTRI